MATWQERALTLHALAVAKGSADAQHWAEEAADLFGMARAAARAKGENTAKSSRLYREGKQAYRAAEAALSNA